MAAKTSVCGICEQRHVSNHSIVWCPECEEALCSDCKEHHSLAKSSRGHNTIPMSDYLKLPLPIVNIKQYCDDHQQKYLLYCATHENPICYKCITRHGQSCNVVALDDMIADFKTSDTFLELKQNVIDLVENVKRIRADRDTNLKKVHDETQKQISKVREIRLKLNEHLDKLETDIIDTLHLLNHQATEKIQEIITILTQKENDISKYQTAIEDFQKHASDLQAFLGAKEIMPKVEKFDKSIQLLIEDKRLEQLEITCAINQFIRDMFSNVKVFGSVEMKSIATTMNIIKNKNKQAQMFTSIVVKSIEDVNLTFVKKVNTHSRCVRGCCVTSNGSFLFTDYNEHLLCVVDCDNSNRQIKCDVFDVICIDPNTCAVTSGYANRQGINVINLTSGEVTTAVKLPAPPYGMTSTGDSMICCVLNKDLHVISCSADYRISTINNTTLPSYSYVAALGDYVYYTKDIDHTVTCCRRDGTVTWQYKNENILKCPRGITLDKHGNICVVGQLSHNVVVISPDGKQCKEILTKKHGLDKPSTVYFDKTMSQLLVANLDSGLAFVFRISS